jgi:biopolymer transport protein TolQ
VSVVDVVAQDISYWHLIAEASLVVKLVMLILVGAIWSALVIIFNRMQVLGKAKRTFFRFEDKFWSGIDLTQLYRDVSSKGDNISGGEQIFKAGFKEFSRLRQTPGADNDSVMVATQRAMRVTMNREADKLDKHLTILATIGSISPYIGLFGTVWGIMNSFLGLASQSQASIATVAPGIAEALIATAMGLLAAIPAVIAYNRYSHQADSIVGNYENFVEEFTSILQRQLHLSNQQASQAPAQKPASSQLKQTPVKDKAE